MGLQCLQSGRNRSLEKYSISGHGALYPATASQTTDERFKGNMFLFVVKQKGVKIGRLVRERQPNCLVDDLRDRRPGFRGSQPKRLMNVRRKINSRPRVLILFFMTF